MVREVIGLAAAGKRHVVRAPGPPQAAHELMRVNDEARRASSRTNLLAPSMAPKNSDLTFQGGPAGARAVAVIDGFRAARSASMDICLPGKASTGEAGCDLGHAAQNRG